MDRQEKRWNPGCSARRGVTTPADTERAAEDRALEDLALAMRSLRTLVRPSPERREMALAQLRGALSRERAQQSRHVAGNSARLLPLWLRARAGIRRLQLARPLRLQALAAATAVLLLLISGAAASIAGPEVSQAFRTVFNSEADLKLEGTIIGVHGDVLAVRTSEGIRLVKIDDVTQITGDGMKDLAAYELVRGQFIKVKGRQERDGAILASHVRLEEGASSEQAPDRRPRAPDGMRYPAR